MSLTSPPPISSERRSIAIMQPYIFPYIGYFQLLAAVDCFVIYDDVQFIKGGWINRNRILVNGQPMLFTVPLVAPSPNRKICDIVVDVNQKWRNKLLQTINQNYSRAPQFDNAFPLVERVINNSSSETIADLVRVSLTEIVKYLGIQVDIVPTSVQYNNQHLSAQERVLDICAIENASDYTNAIGGMALYDSESFMQKGIKLHFLRPNLSSYDQHRSNEFVSGLSIIDVLMNNSVEIINKMLLDFTLV